MSRRRAVKVPRRFLAGTPVDTEPGARLRVAVLARLGSEIFGVDLASGGFVRAEVLGSSRDSDEGEATRDPARPARGVGAVVMIEVADDEPVDPGRPEALWCEGEPATIGVLKARQLRRLLRAVSAPEVRGALVLGSRVASTFYAELDPSKPSLMVLGFGLRGCRLSAPSADEAQLTFVWGGMRQTLRIADPRALGLERRLAETLRGDALARFLGFKPHYALVANLPVRDGYVTKAVLGLYEG